jgi:hypothetical protein
MAIFYDVRGRIIEAENFADFNDKRKTLKSSEFSRLARVTYCDPTMPLKRTERPPRLECAPKQGGTETPPQKVNIQNSRSKWRLSVAAVDRHAKRCKIRSCGKCDRLMKIEAIARNRYIKLGGKIPC